MLVPRKEYIFRIKFLCRWLNSHDNLTQQLKLLLQQHLILFIFMSRKHTPFLSRKQKKTEFENDILQTVKIKNIGFYKVLTYLVLKRAKTVECFFVFLVHTHRQTQKPFA